MKEDWLENPTSFAVGAISREAGFNNRTQKLLENGLVNRVGKVQQKLKVMGDELYFGNRNVKDINRDLEKAGLGKLVLRPISTLATDMPALDNANNVEIINPPEAQYFASDKAFHRQEFWGDPGAVVPYQPLDPFVNEYGEDDFDSLRESINGLEDYGLVEQPRADSGGNGIDFYDSFEEFEREYAPDGLPQDALLSLRMPVKFDQRVITAGDELVSTYKRFKNGNGICNISSLPGSNYIEKVNTALERELVEPIDMDELDPAVRNIVTDHIDAMEESTSADNLWVGWDIFGVDADDLEQYPEFVKESLMNEDYRTSSDEYLLLGEPNTSPGSGIDLVNNEYPEQDTAVNIFRYAESLARDTEFSRGIGGVEDIDQNELYSLARNRSE